MKRITQKLMIIASLFLIFQFFIQPVLADSDIDLEYFYNENCGSCIELIPTIDEIGKKYNDTVTVQKKEITWNPEYFKEYEDYLKNSTILLGYPFVILKSTINNTIIKEINELDITAKYIENYIDEYLFQLSIQPLLTQGKIILEYFYNKSSISSTELLTTINETEDKYTEILVVIKKDIISNSTYYNEYQNYLKNSSILTNYPFVILKSELNDTVINEIKENDIPRYIQYLSKNIDIYLSGLKPNETTDENVIVIDSIFGRLEINISGLSLPVLTIVLAGLDSFNPCAFFILIFLLNLLLYAKSRRRMLLIGSIFIFFSGFLYALFMFVLLNAVLLTRHAPIVTIFAGCLALALGLINIKDFFFFKKGASLSIPEDKKPGIYSQMRKLVKNPKTTAAIIGTIILAGTVNFYELLCTLGLPLVFTRNLASYDLSIIEYYTYIFFYNIVYVIPLIIIVFIFVVTLGRRKLTEWHGQIMKLTTGIMLSSFGFLFLYNYQLLENIITPILLLTFSLLATAIISTLWKKYVGIEKRLDLSKFKKRHK
jgi:thiol-disulfide isomerase/thioredoxin